MTINVISDLHCDFNLSKGKVGWLGFDPTKLAPADYLVVAGDTGYSYTERRIFRELGRLVEGKFKRVLHIMGNHSYWAPLPHSGEEQVEEAYFTSMLGNETIDVVDGDTAILGTTLWTNNYSPNEYRSMNDYRYIPGFDPVEKLKRYEEESGWLRAKYNEYRERGLKIVVVTHHNPRPEAVMPEASLDHSYVSSAYWQRPCNSTDPDYFLKVREKPSLAGTFIRDVSDIRPEVWVCGHIHEDFDQTIDGTRFVRNSIGYRFPPYSSFNKERREWYEKIIEV